MILKPIQELAEIHFRQTLENLAHALGVCNKEELYNVPSVVNATNEDLETLKKYLPIVGDSTGNMYGIIGGKLWRLNKDFKQT